MAHGNLHVSGLPDGLTDESFRQLFQGYGDILSSKFVPDKRYGFVKFANPEEAQTVVDSVNGIVYGDSKIVVKFADSDGTAKGGAGKGGWGGGACKGSDFGKDGGGKDGWAVDGGGKDAWGKGGAGKDGGGKDAWGKAGGGKDAWGKGSGGKGSGGKDAWGKGGAGKDGGGKDGAGKEGGGKEGRGKEGGGKDGAGKDGWAKGGWGGSGGQGGGGAGGGGEWSPGEKQADQVYIRGLPMDFTDEGLHSVFGPYGTITWSKVLHTEGKDDSAALIQVSSAEVAAWLVSNLDGNIPEGLSAPVQVKFSIRGGSKGKGSGKGNDQGKGSNRYAPYGASPPSTAPSGGAGQSWQQSSGSDDSNLYVKGLPKECDELYLYKLFSPYGAIQSVKPVVADWGAIGFVKFAEAPDATAAIQALTNQTLPDGSHIQVSVKRPAPGKGNGKAA